MNIYTIATIVFIVVMLAAGGYMWYRNNTSDELRHYANAEYGVSFDYPSRYKLTETNIENATGTRVTITDKGFRMPENGEGPTAITVDMFKDTGMKASKKKTAAEMWIASSTYSNWNISDMEAPGPTRIGDVPAWLYTWDGLYRGISVVTDRNDSIYMFSVTYDGESDLEKREAFSDLMESVRFDESSAATSTSATPAP